MIARRSRHRPRRVPPQEPDHAAPSSPIRSRHVQPTDAKDEYDSGEYYVTLDRACKEIDWAEKSKLQGKLIDGRYHGLGVVCFIEGGAAGPKESARLEINKDGTHFGLHRLVVGRPGRRDGVRADRRRRARSADRPHPWRLSRLDRLCERRLRRLSFALDRDGRLGAARRHQQFHGDAARRPPAKRLGCAESEVSSTTTRWRAGGAVDGACRIRRPDRRRRVPQPQAHLQLRRAGGHIAVDPKIGRIEIIDYVVVEDVGRIINPLTLRGQVIGSLVQGLGGAFLEDLKYDEHGQLLTGSLADYLLPTASDFPNLRCVVLDDVSVAEQSARRQGRGRGRHHRRRRQHGQCSGQCAASLSALKPRELPLTPPHLGAGADWRRRPRNRCPARASLTMRAWRKNSI